MIYYEIIVNWCKYCINKDCKFYNEPCGSCSYKYFEGTCTQPNKFKRKEE